VRAITVRQPWAWAIVHGGKDVENRTRNIAGAYRGPVAIHAGREIDFGAADDFMLRRAWHLAGLPQRPVQDAPGLFEPLFVESFDEDAEWLPTGTVIGVVDLVDVHWPGITTWRNDVLVGMDCGCSAWAMPLNHHLVLANPRPLAAPIPARGRLGLWTVPADLEAAIREQVPA